MRTSNFSLIIVFIIFFSVFSGGLIAKSSSNSINSPDSIIWTEKNTVNIVNKTILNGDFETGDLIGFDSVYNVVAKAYTQPEFTQRTGGGFYYVSTQSSLIGGSMSLKSPILIPPQSVRAHKSNGYPYSVSLYVNPKASGTVQTLHTFMMVNISYVCVYDSPVGSTQISFRTTDSIHAVKIPRGLETGKVLPNLNQPVFVPLNRWSLVTLALASEMLPKFKNEERTVIAKISFEFYPTSVLTPCLDGFRINNYRNIGMKAFNGGFETGDLTSWTYSTGGVGVYKEGFRTLFGRTQPIGGEIATPVEILKDWIKSESAVNITNRVVLRAKNITSAPPNQTVVQELKAWFNDTMIPVAKTVINYTASTTQKNFTVTKSLNLTGIVPIRYIDLNFEPNRFLVINQNIGNLLPVNWWQKRVSYVRTVFVFASSTDWNASLDLYSIGIMSKANITVNYIQRKIVENQEGRLVLWVQNSNEKTVMLQLKIITGLKIKSLYLDGTLISPISDEGYILGSFRAGEAKLLEIYLNSNPITLFSTSAGSMITLRFYILIDSYIFPDTTTFQIDTIPFTLKLDDFIKFGDRGLIPNSRVITAGNITLFSLKIPFNLSYLSAQVPITRIEAGSQITVNHSKDGKYTLYVFNITEPKSLEDYVNITIAIAENSGRIRFGVVFYVITGETVVAPVIMRLEFQSDTLIEISRIGYAIELIDADTIKIIYLNRVVDVAIVFEYVVNGTVFINKTIITSLARGAPYVAYINVTAPTDFETLNLSIRVFFVMERYSLISDVLNSNITLGKVINLTADFGIVGSYVVGFEVWTHAETYFPTPPAPPTDDLIEKRDLPIYIFIAIAIILVFFAVIFWVYIASRRKF